MTHREHAQPAVSFDGVGRAFGTVLAVDGVGLDIPRGETVALLGRNGAGKSTAIALLLGLDEPDTGTVRLFGGPPARAVAAGRVGAMLQDGRPIRRVTVRELITFVASALPRPLPVAEALALAGLTDLADRRVDKLSGCQTQRLWFPVELFPGRLRSLAGYTPANRFAGLGRSVTRGSAPGALTVAVLLGWLFVFGSYAVVSYRRSARTA